MQRYGLEKQTKRSNSRQEYFAGKNNKCKKRQLKHTTKRIESTYAVRSIDLQWKAVGVDGRRPQKRIRIEGYEITVWVPTVSITSSAGGWKNEIFDKRTYQKKKKNGRGITRGNIISYQYGQGIHFLVRRTNTNRNGLVLGKESKTSQDKKKHCRRHYDEVLSP